MGRKQTDNKSRIVINSQEKTELPNDIEKTKILSEKAYRELKNSAEILNSKNFQIYIETLLYPKRYDNSKFFEASAGVFDYQFYVVCSGVYGVLHQLFYNTCRTRHYLPCRYLIGYYGGKYVYCHLDKNSAITYNNTTKTQA